MEKLGRAGGGKLEGMSLKEEKKEKRRIVEDRLLEVERRIKMKEREERRRNIIIKKVEVKEGKRKEAVEEILKALGVKVDMKEVKKLGEEGKGREMLLVKLKEEKQKREIMRKKKKLKGRRETVMEDWIWKKRKMR